ncbi:MAG: hypothetical protein ACHREM_10730 [Polyangiales bacterium]
MRPVLSSQQGGVMKTMHRLGVTCAIVAVLGPLGCSSGSDSGGGGADAVADSSANDGTSIGDADASDTSVSANDADASDGTVSSPDADAGVDSASLTDADASEDSASLTDADASEDSASSTDAGDGSVSAIDADASGDTASSPDADAGDATLGSTDADAGDATLGSTDADAGDATLGTGDSGDSGADGSSTDAGTTLLTVTEIAAGGNYACAVMSNGVVRCWGPDVYTVPGITNAKHIAAAAVANTGGGGHACVVLATGEIQCWGSDAYGELGDGDTTGGISTSPFTVKGISNAVAVAAGTGFTCAIVGTGTVECWGRSDNGQMGHGTVAGPDACNGTKLNCQLAPTPVTGITNALLISAGDGWACALLADLTVSCWGTIIGYVGGIGDSPSPASAGISNVTQIASTSTVDNLALLADGTVMGWGESTLGEIGTGCTKPECAPIAVSGLSGVKAIGMGGVHGCAVLDDGTVQCWGDNQLAQCGQPFTGPDLCSGLACVKTPTTVAGITNAIQVVGGSFFTCILMSDGHVKCLGVNADGELGTGSNSGPDNCGTDAGAIGCSASPVAVSSGLYAPGTAPPIPDAGPPKDTGAGYPGCTSDPAGDVACSGAGTPNFYACSANPGAPCVAAAYPDTYCCP